VYLRHLYLRGPWVQLRIFYRNSAGAGASEALIPTNPKKKRGPPRDRAVCEINDGGALPPPAFAGLLQRFAGHSVFQRLRGRVPPFGNRLFCRLNLRVMKENRRHQSRLDTFDTSDKLGCVEQRLI